MAEQRQTKRSLSAEGAGVSGEDSVDGDGGAGQTDGAKRRRQDAADGNETNIAYRSSSRSKGVRTPSPSLKKRRRTRRPHQQKAR